MSFHAKFKNLREPSSKEPTAESNVFGLELTVERKEGTLSVVGLKPYAVEDYYYVVTIKSNGMNNEYPENEKVWTKHYTRLLPGENANVGTTSVYAVSSAERFTRFQLAENPSDPSEIQITAFVDDKSDGPLIAMSISLRVSKAQIREACQQALQERVAVATEEERARVKDHHAATLRRQEELKRRATKITIKPA